MKINSFPSWDKLQQSSWRVRYWADQPFMFLSYAGSWRHNFQRAAHECKVQRLLTPSWENPLFPHPIESAATEWGWNLKPEGRTAIECYQWMQSRYLKKIAPFQNDSPSAFYSLTGHSWYSSHAAQWGTDMIGLETGENIIAMQAQIAFLRGAARQNDKPFYVQPSQWFGGTIPIFQEGEDEYTPHQLDEAKVLAGIAKGGIAIPNGGHSPSLLSRMWYVGWLSGAAIVCPENCQVNFFNSRPEDNWSQPAEQRISLSPIGQRAQNFMSITELHSEIGVPFTPFAIMLDQFCGFNGFPLTQPRPWNVLPPELEDREISLFLDTIFPRSMYLDFMPGIDVEQEDRRLVPSPYGDCFDVLLSNVSFEVLLSYPVLICLGPQRFSAQVVDKLNQYLESGGIVYLTYAHANQLKSELTWLQQKGTLICYGLVEEEIPTQIEVERWYTPPHWGADQETLQRRKKGSKLLDYEQKFVAEVKTMVSLLSERYLPISFSGQIQLLINRIESGWLIGLVNNDGVTKERMAAVKLDPSKAKTVSIGLKEQQVKSVQEWCTGSQLTWNDQQIWLEVPAGEVRILEVKTNEQ